MKKKLQTKNLSEFFDENIRKIIILLVISIFLLNYSAFSATNQQQEKVTISLKKGSFAQLVEQVTSQTKYTILFKKEDVAKISNLTIEKTATVESLLKEVLTGSGLTFSYEKNSIVISKIPAKTPDKKFKVNVKIIDEENKTPVLGATILIKGTNNGNISDDKGMAVINNVSVGDVLEIAFVGYVDAVIPINSEPKGEVVIPLKNNVIAVDEVIVTGYQVISKERATGSFATVNTKSMETKLQPDLKSALEGQVSGLVSDKDGNISIRGVSTLSASKSPLIVLDGYPFEGTLSDINSDNIENITVLKDGVSASLYGSRAANGVIVVTTKRGKKDKFTVSYKGVFSTTLKQKYSDLNRGTTSEYIDAEMEIFRGEPSLFIGNKTYVSPVKRVLVDEYLKVGSKLNYMDMEKVNKMIDPLRSKDFSKQIDKLARSKMIHSHNIGINGGTDKNLFNASVNYTGTTNTLPQDKSNRFILDMKNNWKPKEWLSFDIATNFNYTKEESTVFTWLDLVSSQSVLEPYYDIMDENGNSIDIDTPIAPYYQDVFSKTPNMLPVNYNIIDEIGQRMNYGHNLKIRMTGNITIKIIDGLTVTGGGVWARGSSKDKTISRKESYYVRRAVNSATDKNDYNKKYLPYGDIMNGNAASTDTWTLRTQINFNKNFSKDKHRITALIGNEIRRDTYEYNYFATHVGYNQTAGSVVPIDIKSWNAGVDDTKMVYGRTISLSNPSISQRDNRFVSWYGNASYEFNNKYLVSGSVRLDLTNFFGTDPKYRYRPLWSVGGTWKLSNEKFFDVKAIDMLNIRASYGINGNILTSQGPFLILSVGSYSDYTEGTPYGVSSPPNNQLRWEKTATTNVGFDLSVLNRRLNLTVDYYNKLSTDLFGSDTMDPISGYSSVSRNIGSIRNRGIEVTINANVIDGKSFKWNSSFNFSYNKNTVLKYNYNFQYNHWLARYPVNREGYPGSSLFSYKYARINELGNVLAYTKDGEELPIAQMKVEDIIHSGTAISPYDLSFTNRFTYKGFDLSFMFVSKLGNVFRKDSFDGSNFHNRHFSERWQKAGDEENTIYPRFQRFNADLWYNPFRDVLVANAGFLKLRDVTLTYRLPKQAMKSIGISDARIYVQSRNLFRITAKGVDVDPESMKFSSASLSAGVDQAYSYFSLRPEFYVGLSFSF